MIFYRLFYLKIFFTAVICLLAGAPFIVQANTNPFFSLKPVKEEVLLSAGETATRTLVVTNHLGRPSFFKLAVEDLDLPNNPTLFSLGDYLKLATTTIYLENGGSLPVTLSFVSVGARPAGIYGFVSVSASPIASGQAKVSATLAELIFLRIKGLLSESGRLTSFGIVGNSFQWFPSSVKLHFSYQNTGQIYLNPYGKIRLVNFWGKEKILDVRPWSVLPGETKLREIDLGGELFGRYQATIYLNRGYANKIEMKTISFWVIPRFLWFLLFLPLVAVVVIIMLKLKVRK